MATKGAKHGSAYFDGFIKSKGLLFSQEERPENLKRKIPILIKDIAYGNITEKYYKFFDYHFMMDILMPELTKLYTRHYIHYQAMLNYYSTVSSDQTVLNTLQEDGELCAAYSIAMQYFEMIVKANGNLSYLPPMAEKLHKYRFRL